MSRDENVRRVRGLDVDYGELDGFQSGRAAAILDWQARREDQQYRRLFKRLVTRKWYRSVVAEGGERLARLREQQRKQLKAWREKNPEKRRMLDRARRAKKRVPRVITCEVCGRKKVVRALVTTPGKRPRWCSKKCANHHHAVMRAKRRNRGIRTMGLAKMVLAALADGAKTFVELRAILPAVKAGSLATKLCTMTKAGELLRVGPKKGARFTLPEGRR